MSDDELREELCKDIYNKANSHEMIRRLAKLAWEFAGERDKAMEKMADYKEIINSIRLVIDELEEAENQ